MQFGAVDSDDECEEDDMADTMAMYRNLLVARSTDTSEDAGLRRLDAAGGSGASQEATTAAAAVAGAATATASSSSSLSSSSSSSASPTLSRKPVPPPPKRVVRVVAKAAATPSVAKPAAGLGMLAAYDSSDSE